MEFDNDDIKLSDENQAADDTTEQNDTQQAQEGTETAQKEQIASTIQSCPN